MELRKYDQNRKLRNRSLAQKWAQERNWNKAQVKNIIGNLRRIANYHKSTLIDEKGQLNEAADIIQLVLDNWDSVNTFSKNRFIQIEKEGR